MQLARTHIIAFTNQKGGCGKTTSTVSVAAACARLGLKVTVVDTDPQCNATDSFGLDREKLAEEGKFNCAIPPNPNDGSSPTESKPRASRLSATGRNDRRPFLRAGAKRRCAGPGPARCRR